MIGYAFAQCILLENIAPRICYLDTFFMKKQMCTFGSYTASQSCHFYVVANVLRLLTYLSDGDGGVEVSKSLVLVLLILDVDVELLDTLESELLVTDEQLDRVTHELLGDLEDLGGHGRGAEDNLK